MPSLSFNALQPELLTVADELQAFRDQIERGATLVGQELDRLDEQALLLDRTSQQMQAAIAQEVAQRLAQASDRQSRHERVTSHLHATVAEEGSQALQRDRMLNEEIIDLKQRHKKELDQQQQTIDQLIREVTRQKELHQNREKEIADLRGLVEGLVARTSE